MRRGKTETPLEVSKFKKKHKGNKPLTGQDIQDDIFKKMSADRKVELGSQLWSLAKDIAGNKINHGARRSKASFSKSG